MRSFRWYMQCLALVAAFTASLYFQRTAPQQTSANVIDLVVARPVVLSASSTNRMTNAKIVKVVDGDTVIATIDGEAGEQKIRLLGINTPETVDPRKAVECFGAEASDRAKLLLTGARVRLEDDPEADDRDKYDRLLRVLYLEDGRQYNRMMVEDGYAYAYLSFPLNAQFRRELKESEQDARMAGRGLWSTSTCNGVK